MKQSVIHMWEVHEIVLTAKEKYHNPYTDVTVWADLKGPGFEKRVYGFWDGGGCLQNPSDSHCARNMDIRFWCQC